MVVQEDNKALFLTFEQLGDSYRLTEHESQCMRIFFIPMPICVAI